ncbi:16S rRNA (cytosine(1402)-N(4))-methyltransferase RsmH [Pararhodospirillum photometricum]|uniref:Ribosomal RNA small subunit methyltransferase H n=1 Tax=Pararhodospirillum photometricum DSM 122 TaxID=1150469 RepID=H6SNG4_PARPM|nr:16S rRNA (cytosine(1402)-N(4))-methyltransferase RsmH [Pararhodospirillum photometricum]CCG09295.1 Methyltransferase [Pararhodospirillum photometricum DSM 122]
MSQTVTAPDSRPDLPSPLHIPVLRDEAIDALEVRDGGIYVDGTFGAGGYSVSMLTRAACTVWAIDRDPEARARAAALESRFPGRFTLLAGCFGAMEDLLAAHGVTRVDGIALDLGVSSMQIDQPERGFSFRFDGPLDMRMSASGPSAADLVNTLDEAVLADIFYHLGEERHARRVARVVVERRCDTPFTRTGQLAEAVRAVVRKSGDGLDPATRTFQALRVAVNDELGELTRGLTAAERLLTPGGRLAVVSFHSLEDRLVKSFLRGRAGERAGISRHLPDAAVLGPEPTFTLVSRRAIQPGEAEARHNPRARSARLRVGERTAHPAWPVGEPQSSLVPGALTGILAQGRWGDDA